MVSALPRVACLLLPLAVGCAEEEPASVDPTEDALHTLTRASLDLRGARPSDDEIDQVLADPARLDEMLDGFVGDERFPERLVDLYNELYLTRSEASAINVQSLGMPEKEPFLQMVGQEPLRLIAQVAAEDLPYTEVAMADWTVVNDTMAAFFPVDYPEGATGWRKVRYTDGRPAAGVMATDGLWWRYTTTPSNANRGRANTVARLLLCADHLDRDVELDTSIFLLGDDAIQDALNTSPDCVNCHVSLDPLAGHFGGFFLSNYTSVQDALLYHPAREGVWETLSGVAPGYYGVPTSGLVDLGALVASDPRFPTCAVEQAWSLLLRREPTIDDQERLNAIRERFLDGGLTLRSLYRAVVAEAGYQAWGTDEDGQVSSRIATVELLARQVEDLTGFRWTYDGHELMYSDRRGLHLIAGGVDGISQVSPPDVPTPGLLLAQEVLAEVSASYALERESALDPSERRLFTEVDFTETADSDEEALRSQLVVLHRRMYGALLESDSEDVDLGLSLWRDLYAADGDVYLAWQGVLTALLRDPELVIY